LGCPLQFKEKRFSKKEVFKGSKQECCYHMDMLAVSGSIYEVTGTVERSEAIGGTLEQ